MNNSIFRQCLRNLAQLHLIFLVVFLLIAGNRLHADSDPTPADERLIQALRSYIPYVMKKSRTPGLGIALARRGKVIWAEGFGYADLNNEKPMTAQSVFRSGSMSKTYTATAVMQLVEQGIIGLHDPINKFLKEFQVVNPLGERDITFHDLLTHRSGLTNNMAGCRFVRPKSLGAYLKDGYSKKMFEPYKGTMLLRWSAKVGERFRYSNFGIATLGYLVEVTNPEGLSFSEYVQTHIIDPLGMTSTQFPPVQDSDHVREEILSLASKGYAQFGPVEMPTPDIYFSDYPAGTVVTTVSDHIKLLLAYMNGGHYNGYQLLKPETVSNMLSVHVEQSGSPGYTKGGLVWFLANVGQPNFYFGHGGAHMFGWVNDFRAYPKKDYAVVITTNHWPMWSARHKEDKPIYDFIADWLEYEEQNVKHVQPGRSWAWKVSYLIGLSMVDWLKGVMGIEDPLTPEMIDSMAGGARIRDYADNHVTVWDPEGFRTGVEDMLSTEMTLDGIKSFLKSDRLRIAPEELKIIYKALGGNGVVFPILAYPAQKK